VRALITNEAGLDVVVAAPHEERSGASASLIATRSDGRLLVERTDLPDLEVIAYAVEATPAYITWAAVRGAFGNLPDIVLSGINKGPNTGHAVLHSGTVGAALTASAHGLPALAVSVSAPDPSHWETAASVTTDVLAWLLKHDERVVLNVNVPDVAPDDLQGLTHAPLASFGAVQADIAEIGEGFVTLTFSDIDYRSEPDSDAALQMSGWATVTALAAPCEARSSLDGLVD
jgi:5'-nucleotidase